ncbi:hypothetical protein, partial [Thermococcus sp.]
PSGLVIAYPRAYTRGYAIGEVLYDEYTSKSIRELIKKVRKERFNSPRVLLKPKRDARKRGREQRVSILLESY